VDGAVIVRDHKNVRVAGGWETAMDKRKDQQGDVEQLGDADPAAHRLVLTQGPQTGRARNADPPG
jgi:hypothetical protein